MCDRKHGGCIGHRKRVSPQTVKVSIDNMGVWGCSVESGVNVLG